MVCELLTLGGEVWYVNCSHWVVKCVVCDGEVCGM